MNLPTPVTGGPKRGELLTSGSFFASTLRNRASAASLELRGADVGDDLGEVAQHAVRIDQAGLLLAGTP